jgi:hypothetical protein
VGDEADGVAPGIDEDVFGGEVGFEIGEALGQEVCEDHVGVDVVDFDALDGGEAVSEVLGVGVIVGEAVDVIALMKLRL